MPLTSESTKGITIFFSYAQQDQELCEQLETHVSALRQHYQIADWSESKILAGKVRKREINVKLNMAHLILLLLSASFMASEQCCLEMERALERHRAGEAEVITILLRPFHGWEDIPAGKLETLPANGKPVTTWKNRDVAFAGIVSGIRNVIQQLQSKLTMTQFQYAIHPGILGLPPPTHPQSVQQRPGAVLDIYTKLTRTDTTALVLTGLAGVGKSTLAALVSRYAEEQRQAGEEPFTAEPLWLKINPAVTMVDLATTLFEALGKPLPDVRTPQNLATVLFQMLNTVHEPRLIVLDQFEELLDLQTKQTSAGQQGVREWLDALNSQPCRCRLLLTSRALPQGTRVYPSTYLKEYAVKGLAMQEGVELLRMWGITAPEDELQAVVEQCEGHGLALALLNVFLQRRHISLATFLHDPVYARLWTGDIAELLNSVYEEQLDQTQREVLQAFSIYRTPVPLRAVQFLMGSNKKITEAQLALDTLLAQKLLQGNEGYYRPHALVASYVQGHFVENNERQKRKALQKVHRMASQYYLQQVLTSCPPLKLRRRISDVHDLIEAIWHRCQAGQQREAYELMQQEHIFQDLQRWGGNTILLELYTLLLPSDIWQPEPWQAAHIYNESGDVYKMLGQKQQARKYFEKALTIFQDIKEGKGEAKVLNNLGSIYNALGEKEQALACYQRALRLCEEIEDHAEKGTSLNNLGVIFFERGEKEQAKKYFEEALPLHRQAGNRGEEARTLTNLGKLYGALRQKEAAFEYYLHAFHVFQEIDDRWGQGITLNSLGVYCKKYRRKQEAQEYYEQAVRMFREIGDRWEEATTLRNLGRLYIAQGRYEVAFACFLLAQDIFEALRSPGRGEIPRWITDAIRGHIGEQQFERLVMEVEPRAVEIVERALREEI